MFFFTTKCFIKWYGKKIVICYNIVWIIRRLRFATFLLAMFEVYIILSKATTNLFEWLVACSIHCSPSWANRKPLLIISINVNGYGVNILLNIPWKSTIITTSNWYHALYSYIPYLQEEGISQQCLVFQPIVSWSVASYFLLWPY